MWQPPAAKFCGNVYRSNVVHLPDGTHTCIAPVSQEIHTVTTKKTITQTEIYLKMKVTKSVKFSSFVAVRFKSPC